MYARVTLLEIDTLRTTLTDVAGAIFEAQTLVPRSSTQPGYRGRVGARDDRRARAC